MAKTLETAKLEVQAIFTAAISENGKGAMESGLSLDDQGNVCGYLMKKGEGRCPHIYICNNNHNDNIYIYACRCFQLQLISY